MSIKADQKKVSVDFDFYHESEDGNTGGKINVRLHHTPEYGKTLSFSTDEKEYIGLPVSFFAEVVDFLRKEEYLESPKIETPVVAPVAAPVQPKVEQKTRLPLPITQGEATQTQTERSSSNDMDTLNKRPVNPNQPLQSFYPVSQPAAQTPPAIIKTASDNEGDAMVVAAHSKVSKEAAAELSNERKNAKTKQTHKRDIRRAHRTPGEE